MRDLAARLRHLSIGLDRIWPLIILAGFAFYVSLVPLAPNDFWWHLRIGEVIHTTGRIPTTNLFGWTIPQDAPFVYGAWLGAWLLYVLHRWGGLALPLVARTVMVVAAFWLVARRVRLRSGSWRLAAPVLFLAAAMSVNNLTVRPQIWSYLPFALFLLVLERYTRGELRVQWLGVLPVLMVFWVNAHGAFVLGLALLGIVGAGELWRKLLRRPGALSWSRYGWLAASAAATGLATLVNPQGWGIVRYVAGLMTDPPSQQLVVEWQSPTPHGIANVAFFASILALLLVFAFSRYCPTMTDTLLIVGFLWLAWSGQRYVIWYAMAVMPVLADALRGLWAQYNAGPSRRRLLHTALAVLLFAPALLVQPWWVERFPLPDTYRSQVWHGSEVGPLIDTATPLDAAAYLKAHPGGRLFNEMGYGSYLIWAAPEQGVFVDPRVELYPYEQWLDYVRIGDGIRALALLEAYGADRVLLDREMQPELALVLEGDARWSLEYEDTRAQIWTLAGR